MDNKNITILSPHYYPETGAPAKRIYDTSRYLYKRGWSVTVFTLAPHYPENKIHRGYGDVRYDRRVEDGISVVRVRPLMVPKTSFLLRLLSETLFAFQASFFLLRGSGSLIYSTSPYMFLGPLPLLAARIRGLKFVWEVRDLTWEYARATSKKTYGLVTIIEKIMRWTAASSDGLTTATDGLFQYFRKKPKIAAIIYNGISSDNIKRLKTSDVDLLIKERPIVMYAGIVGYAQNLITLLKAAEISRNYDFYIIGDGPEKYALEEYVESREINNVFFKGYLSFQELLEMYEKADIFVAMLKDDPIYNFAQPSKLWEYMSTGKPVVYSGNGEANRILIDYKCGIAVNASDPAMLSEALDSLVNNKEFAKQLGKKGREFVINNRTREGSLNNLNKVLENFLKTS